MPVTVTYAFATGYAGNANTLDGQPDATTLANGGVAFVGTDGAGSAGSISGATLTGVAGVNPALAQLSNGNLVVASQDADSILYKIVSQQGATVLDTVDIGDANSSNADVAALTGGGFVVVNQDAFGATDRDIDFRIYSNDGVLVTSLTVDSTAAVDTGASVAALDNGTFALAWTRTVGADTEIWYAVYAADGSTVSAPQLSDTIGSINRNVSLTATDAGFAFVYEDNGWNGVSEITLTQMDFDGGMIRRNNVSQTAAADEAPQVARMPNGMLAVSYGENAGADTNVVISLVDPADGSVLASTTIASGGDSLSHDVLNGALAVLNTGMVVSLATDLTAGYATQDYQLATRTSTGDGSDQTIDGDELTDTIDGAGRKEVLNGGGRCDDLSAGPGDDRLDGGTFNDSMYGGDGSDTYVVDHVSDLVIESDGQGTDAVESSISYSLTDFVETLTLTGSADINGTGNGAANTLVGNDGANTLNGGAGDDVISGGLGDDILIGGDGVDTLSFAGASSGRFVQLNFNGIQGTGEGADQNSGFENILGSAHNDSLYGDGGDNVVDGGGGADALYGGDGADTLLGGADDDALVGGAGGDILNGGDGVDAIDYTSSALGVYIRLFNSTAFGGDANGDVISNIENVTGSFNNDDLRGSSDANVLQGGSGDDYLEGQGGNDTLIGGLGTDTLFGGAGGDTLDGGDGTDTVSYAGSSLGVYVRLFNNTVFGGDANGDTISGFENAVGSSNNDDLIGSAVNNVLTGGIGADSIQGLGGNDTLIGGVGADTLNGGDGIDTLSYVGSSLAVYVRLFNSTVFGGDANGDVISNVENATGSSNNDDLMGSQGDNALDGGSGADSIQGLGGNDTLIGGAGADTLNGGDGIDTISYAGSAAAVTIDLQLGTGSGGDAAGDVLLQVESVTGSGLNDVLTGAGGANVLTGGVGNDAIQGLGGDDSLIGGVGGDTLNGGDGVDTISYAGSTLGVYVRLFNNTAFGGDANGDVISNVENATGSSNNDDLMGSNGANALDGGAGADLLRGLAGAHTLTGGAGDDTLTGGDGVDRFVFTGASGTDTITDFIAGVGAGEVIQLSSAIFTSFADVLTHTNDDGFGNTVISKSGVQITLTGVLESQLAADDFAFVAGSLAAAPAAPSLVSWQDLQALDAKAGAGLWSAATVQEALYAAEPDLGLSGLGLERPHLVGAPSDYDWVV